MSKNTGGHVPPSRTQRLPRFAHRTVSLFTLALLCAGCGSSTYMLKLRPLPSSAHVYVNGEYRGVGPQNIPLSFAEYQRAYVQVVAPNHEPTLSMYSEAALPPDGEITIRLTEIR